MEKKERLIFYYKKEDGRDFKIEVESAPDTTQSRCYIWDNSMGSGYKTLSDALLAAQAEYGKIELIEIQSEVRTIIYTKR